MEAREAVGLNRDEERLIRRAVEGDWDAREALFGRYRSSLYQTALRICQNPEDAEDAVQDGLLAAFRNLRQFKARSRFSTWLMRVVINAALMQLRRRRAHPLLSIDQDDRQDNQQTIAKTVPDARPGPEESYAQKERMEIFARGIRTLPWAQGIALWLRGVEGFPLDEAARILHVPTGTLKSNLHRGRARLAAYVQASSGPVGQASAAA